MNPLPRALLTFVGIFVAGIVLIFPAWGIASYFAGNMTLEGAFMVSPFVGVLFVPMLLACVVQGIRRGYLVYRSS